MMWFESAGIPIVNSDTGHMLELGEMCSGDVGVAGGVTDRPSAVSAGALGQVGRFGQLSKVLPRLSKRSPSHLGLLQRCG